MDSGHHTRAVNLANSDVKRVIDSFKEDPLFMGKSREAEKRQRERDELIASAHPDVQGLRGILPDTLIERLAKLEKEG